MEVKKITLNANGYLGRLLSIPVPPQTLFVTGESLENIMSRPRITVIGSRKVSAYGKAATALVAGGLARAGVIIVSGLAIGIDSLAHQAALEANTPTVAVLPGSIEQIYPASHRGLAERIVKQGGALVTEYSGYGRIYKSNFIARNRIASALGDGVLIIEAAEKSGTLHTARFALEQGKDVFVIPGNITSPTSAGTNNLIKAGATPVTSAADILLHLGLAPAVQNHPKSEDPDEQAILDLIQKGLSDAAEIQRDSGQSVDAFDQHLTMLELQGAIRPLGNNQWSLN